MTTIAYKDSKIVFDSMLSSDSLIISNDYKKFKQINDIHFFYAGAISDRDRLLKAYVDNSHTLDRGVYGNALVVDKGQVYYIGVSDALELWVEDVDIDMPYAIGSGQQLAIAYMDCGLSALEAVKMTSNRDPFTGGVIRVFDLENKTISEVR